MKFGMGQSVPREEDKRLVTGRGRYTDDIDLPGQARGHVLRSPFAHARVISIDTTEARRAPGVLAVLTGADYVADGLGPLPCAAAAILPLRRPDGSPAYVPPRTALVTDRVRFVGDAVAFVVAETHAQARDAAELIEVEYEELPVASDIRDAAADGAPVIWDDCPDNLSFRWQVGNRDGVEAAFADAHHVTKLEYTVTRIAMTPMEPRAAVASYDAIEDRFTLYCGVQSPHMIRRFLAQVIFKVPETSFRVVSPDMGGAFGMRSNTHPEIVLSLWAARRIGRPVKWTSDRSEGFLSDEHGRDSHWTIELALDRNGIFTGLRARSLNTTGAYVSLFGPFPIVVNSGGLAGVYRTPAILFEALAYFTNTVPIAPYRGAGRPEASLAIERLIDAAARELGIDRVELRRRNLIAPDQLPFQTGLAYKYDSGDFEKILNRTVELIDYPGFEKRRDEARSRGKLRGLGIVNSIEQSAGGFEEHAHVRFDSGGSITVLVGTHNHGQGHETIYKQLVSERFGVDVEAIRIVQGDTDLVPYGNGTFGSRSSGLGMAAISRAADKVIEKGRRIAGFMLEASAADIEFRDGEFRIAGTDRRVPLKDVARQAFMRGGLPPDIEPGLMADGLFMPPAPTYPNGSHAAEIEIDPDTGVLEILRYVVVDDVGTVINPMLLKGQIHGGVVQGLGQIMLEDMIYERETGQVVTGSLMDYGMPRADMVPSIEVESMPVPSPTNPLGIKGAGEAGTVGAMPCLMSAVIDALSPLGITEIAMPVTPERLWRAIRAAR